MSKSKKEKYLKKAINKERAKNQMIRDTRKTTAYGFILLAPFITMFGVMAYAMTQ
ncbi:MAG: hypothetical protein QNL05_14410 [Gammaproteobacteria bacterium]|nr:hypothetical protein [Gammaproteobacteria bacterium]MDX2488693.1 hypothetical protein [Gammaproteobacteria bacterium]